MAKVYVTEAADANYESLAEAIDASEAEIEISGVWTDVDNDGLANGESLSVDATTVITVAAAALNTNGYPGRAGNAYQLSHDAGSGHVFTMGGAYDLTISDMDIVSNSTNNSDEIFRVGTNESDITCNRCHLGFSGAQAEQDILYFEGDSDTVAFSFTSCMFYDVGRSIVDAYDAQGCTATINFNSCSGWNIGAVNGREDGVWVGWHNAGSGGTVIVNVFNSLVHGNIGEVGFSLASADTTTLNMDYCITNYDADIGAVGGNIGKNIDTVNQGNGNTYSVGFVEGDPAATQVGLIETGT